MRDVPLFDKVSGAKLRHNIQLYSSTTNSSLLYQKPPVARSPKRNIRGQFSSWASFPNRSPFAIQTHCNRLAHGLCRKAQWVELLRIPQFGKIETDRRLLMYRSRLNTCQQPF